MVITVGQWVIIRPNFIFHKSEEKKTIYFTLIMILFTGRGLTTISVSIKISKPRIGNRADNEVRLNSPRPRGPIIYSFVGNEVKL